MIVIVIIFMFDWMYWFDIEYFIINGLSNICLYILLTTLSYYIYLIHYLYLYYYYCLYHYYRIYLYFHLCFNLIHPITFVEIELRNYFYSLNTTLLTIFLIDTHSITYSIQMMILSISYQPNYLSHSDYSYTYQPH